MKLLRNLIGLLAMIALHVALQQFVPAVGRLLDPFLVWIVLQGLAANPLRGMLAGLVGGWCEDALTGESLFGLHGVAGTMVGYLVAQATRQLSTASLPVLGLLFALAAALHEALLMALQMLLNASPATLDPAWVGVRALLNGVFGIALIQGGGRMGRWGQELRQSRRRKIRLDA